MAQQRFIERHGLWTDEQRAVAERVKAEVKEKDLRQIRVSWGDQHGILRGKTLTVTEFLSSLEDGKDFQFVTSIFDTTNHPIVPPFGAGNFVGAPELTGLPDGVLVPDPTTFRLLPWVEKTGWILSDAYFQNGREHPFSTRGVLRRQMEDLAKLGYSFTAGLEIEFYVFRMLDPNLRPEQCGYPPEPPTVNGLAHGFQYLTENRNDEIHDLLWELQDHTQKLGLPLLTIEDEWGAGQIEFTFAPEDGMRAADHALLFRSAIKQICRRLGFHATFMARPAFPDYFASGWHVHQSLTPVGGGGNAFTDETGKRRLTDAGMQWMGGLLEHAVPASVFTTPTINGYKRYRPDSFAPDRVVWAVENRGAATRDRRARLARLPRREPCWRPGREPVPAAGVADRVGRRRPASQARSGRSGGGALSGPGQDAATGQPHGRGRGTAGRSVLHGGVRRAVRRLLRAPQGVRDRPLPAARHRLGAPRVLRGLLI